MAFKLLRHFQLRKLSAEIKLEKTNMFYFLHHLPYICDPVASQIDDFTPSKFVSTPSWPPAQKHLLSFYSSFSKLAVSGNDEEWIQGIIQRGSASNDVEEIIVKNVRSNVRILKSMNLGEDKIAAIFSGYKRMYSTDRSDEIEKAAEVFNNFGIQIADMDTRFYRSLEFVSKGKCVPILKYLSEELKIENLASALSENIAALYWDVSEVKRRIDLIQSFGVKMAEKFIFLKGGLMHQSFSNIERSMTFLVSLVGNDLACTLVQKNITILKGSVETIKDNFCYLERTFGAKVTRAILDFQPHVLCAMPSKRDKTASELTRVFGRENFIAMVKKSPVLLVLEWQSNLSPKLDYILKEMNDRREEVIHSPGIMAYSLEKRLKPRLEKLKVANVEEKLISLRALLRGTDAEFKSLVVRLRKA